jgi:hydroxyethylthiazole kinase-like uncharacterized protein yjeF
MMQGIQVVAAQEMAQIEKEGDPERFMLQAGEKVFLAAQNYIQTHSLSKEVTLLIGKGNNGGDAYAAGLCLLEKGYQVQAYCLFNQVSPLNRKLREKFKKQGGKFAEELKGLLIDGLLGTGFKGKVEGKLAALIRAANDSHLPIIAVDIPSGLNGTTGSDNGEIIIANETVALGLPKIGFFINEGWKFVGRLRIGDFGLTKEAMASVDAIAYLPRHLDLPRIDRIRHKYQAGYVIAYAGSKAFPGAAKLAGLAALRSGAGIVRIFQSEDIGSTPLELICNEWNAKEWKKALSKAQALFIGPGLGVQTAWLKKHLKEINKPCVIDADALQYGLAYPKQAILTPHRGEVLRLLGLEKVPRDEELFAKIIRFCGQKEVYVVLKGAPTVIFAPHHKPLIIPRGDPGMATAGSGDVLTGMIASLLAQGCKPYEATALGVTLHAIAGEKAAEKKSSYCLIASDLIEFMPSAFQTLMKGHDII